MFINSIGYRLPGAIGSLVLAVEFINRKVL